MYWPTWAFGATCCAEAGAERIPTINRAAAKTTESRTAIAHSLAPTPASRDTNFRRGPADIAAWLVPVVLIVYLGLNNGGYDPIAREEIGVAVWWIVLLGTALSVLPPAGGTREGRAVMLLLVAFAAWTALALTWTESSEKTAIELARVSIYLAVFILALAAKGNGRWRHMLSGVTTGIVIVCGIAVLSRIHPAWFPKQHVGQYLTGIQIESRLAYPINYPSGLGAFGAIGLPLLLASTSSARTLVGRALAAAGIPLVALTLWLTTSSLALPTTAIGLFILLALAPDRLPKIAALGIAGGASAVLFYAVQQRPELDRGLPTAAAEHQGTELLWILALVCIGVALLQIGLDLVVRHGRRPSWLQISRRTASTATATALVVALVGAIGAGFPGWAQDQWEVFKGRDAGATSEASRGSQILDPNSSGRYQFWQAAVDANATSPLHGIGPGTFEFWWARNGSYAGYVRDAHSLYIETLAELGIVGLLLVAGLSASILGIGGWRALRAPPELRLGLAAATAGCAGFVVAAAVDWMWELAVLPVVFFILAAIASAGGAEVQPVEPSEAAPAWRRHRGRIAIAVLSVAGLFAIAQPLVGGIAIERSYDAEAAGRYDDALNDARDAQSIQPYAASPRLQEAKLLERRGDLKAAAAAARAATERESTNWLTWFTLAAIERRAGDRKDAAADREQARSLNPLSSLFAP